MPIALMLFHLSSLTVLLIQAEQKTHDVDRSKTIISKADALLKDYYE
jgi:hypothetical protein